ncbi:MAG: DUF4339 domain-containing protein [Planctomycetes bacterium]|nr:DUF4339 domain-containing protein [Planctomycetota bacterium]
MPTRWFYSQFNLTHGPFSAGEIKALAAEGKIAPTDLVWPEGAPESDRAPAAAVLDIGTSMPNQCASAEASSPPTPPQSESSSESKSAEVATETPAELPDWLQDVSALEKPGPLPEPEPDHDLPAWLDDMRLWVALELGESPWEMDELIPWDRSLGPPPVGVELSRLVETWRIPTEPPPAGKTSTGPPSAKPPRSQPTPVKPTPAKPTPAKPTQVRPTRVKRPTAEPEETPITEKDILPDEPPAYKPPAPFAQPAVRAELPSPLGGEGLGVRGVPLARPVAPPPPAVRSAASRAVEDALVERTTRETGFDPRSGKVIDAVRFQKWKREKAGPSSPANASNSSLFEDFHRARAAVEHWLDEDANRHYIMACDHRAIRDQPTIQGIFKFYEKHGTVFRAKLLRHLEFITENRSQYYKARGEG